MKCLPGILAVVAAVWEGIEVAVEDLGVMGEGSEWEAVLVAEDVEQFGFIYP